MNEDSENTKHIIKLKLKVSGAAELQKLSDEPTVQHGSILVHQRFRQLWDVGGTGGSSWM